MAMASARRHWQNQAIGIGKDTDAKDLDSSNNNNSIVRLPFSTINQTALYHPPTQMTVARTSNKNDNNG